MAFSQSLVLLATVPFLLLFFFLKRMERARAVSVSSTSIGKSKSVLFFFTRIVPKIFWLSVAFLAVVALAGPVKSVPTEGIAIEGRIKCISLDFSYSMRATTRSKTGRSSVEVIKEVTMPFVEKRATTDFITVTVYGGKDYGPENGDATILVRPTQNADFIKQQIKGANPGVVGNYTSIGEGIFTCLSSMLDQEFQNHDIDRFLLREGLEKGNWRYPELVVKKIGRMRNMIIVLFTDGVNNAGIDPLTMVQFTRMLGIRVYFSVLESTADTGVSDEEGERRREELKNAVRSTGGFDFATKVAEDVELHYDKIDKFERAKVRIVSNFSTMPLWREWLFASIVMLTGFSLVEIIFIKLP
ncbi:MAG: hypothetical protein HYW90_00975 [Candidatus Sungbacteria bacterium]|nr:hypothetical protein [Candidatus Sungbacteria bacterium]